MAKRSVSMREIARSMQLSPATVSNALNGKPGVGRELAEEIRRTAVAMGWKRPGSLESVQFVIARRSGRMIDEGSFRLAVINGIESEARRHGVATAYATVELADRHLCARRLAQLSSEPSSGIILLGTEMEEADYDLFADLGMPLVVVDGVSDNHFFESIVFSNEGSAHRAVRYLVSKGHTRIGYLAGKLRIRNFPLRERGWRRALEESGLPARDEWRVELGTDGVEAAHRDMLAWLDGAPSLPTAFFADNDAIAVGAMQALAERGVSVPEDVSIVGFDDLEYASAAHPPLTTVHVPRFEIGRLAAKKLLEQAEEPPRYTCVTHLSTRLVERRSVHEL